jgi:PilZ domain
VGPDLRRSPRVPFIASAEITDVEKETRLPARTGDLSEHGCYIDMMYPLPLGTAIRVQIAHGERTFANAGVVYSQPPLGMGVVFRDVESTQQLTLRKWLSDTVVE